ncbi:MAG: cation:proton antiporter [Dehalococcoidia bacterium]|nr:MAG: cation:proton antiporter [Dehalococcoidia bacterium]
MSSLGFFFVALIVVGLYGVLAKVNLLKVVLGLAIMSLGVAGLVTGIGSEGAPVAEVPQTLGVIAVVGGVSVAALLVVTAVRLYEKYGSLDIREMRRLKG